MGYEGEEEALLIVVTVPPQWLTRIFRFLLIHWAISIPASLFSGKYSNLLSIVYAFI